MNSPYLNERFRGRIKKHLVKTIIECGSRDGDDTVALYEYYKPQKMFAFECNPESIVNCRERLKKYPEITLVEKAVCNRSGKVKFYATDMERSIDKNIGASSLLYHRDNKVEFFQKEIEVNAIRLDAFMAMNKIRQVDLLCLDIQGAEMLAFEGLGARFRDVRYIITEVSFERFYEGDCLFKDMRGYLHTKGFSFLIGSGLVANRVLGSTDCLFEQRI